VNHRDAVEIERGQRFLEHHAVLHHHHGGFDKTGRYFSLA
jgi:hypothetical protein